MIEDPRKTLNPCWKWAGLKPLIAYPDNEEIISFFYVIDVKQTENKTAF